MPHGIFPAELARMMVEGEPYMPSNGTEGEIFIESWCGECAHDKEMNGTCYAEGRDAGDGDWCEILGASYRGEAKEWQYGPDGQPRCTAFTPMGLPAVERCEHTADMFAPQGG